MKSERRHELRENDLAHFLVVARDYLDKNGGRVGLIIVGALVVLVLIGFAVRSRASAAEDIWRQRGALRFDSPEAGRASLAALRQLTETSRDRSFVMSGLIKQGREALRMAQAVPDPPDRGFTETAAVAFEELRRRFADNPVAVGLALNGLVSVEANLFLLDGDRSRQDKADQYLKQIIDHAGLNGTPIQQTAIDRRAALDRIFTRVTLTYPPPPEDPVDEAGVDLADPLPAVDEAEGVDRADDDVEGVDAADPVEGVDPS